jgi:hypothetical protein
MSYSGILAGLGAKGRTACRQTGIGGKRVTQQLFSTKRGLLTESYARGPSSVSKSYTPSPIRSLVGDKTIEALEPLTLFPLVIAALD